MTTQTGSSPGLPPDDDALIEQLRAVASQVDAPPELVLDAARSAFLLRRLDSELAQLVLDSAADLGTDRLVAVRGGETAGATNAVRMLSFATDRVSLEVQVTATDATAGRYRLLGMVTGASGTVEVETDESRSTVEIDDLGRFAVDDIPAGTVRLHLTADDGSAVTTSWVAL